MKKDFADLLDQLSNQPALGTPIGQHCFKIRMPIASKGKGKSGGARVFATVYLTERKLYLLSSYDKGQQETITDKELLELLKMIPK